MGNIRKKLGFHYLKIDVSELCRTTMIYPKNKIEFTGWSKDNQMYGLGETKHD